MKRITQISILFFLLSILVFVCCGRLISAQAENLKCIERFQMYSSPVGNAFGPSIIHHSGWDRYLMYFSINSTVKNDYPSLSKPGDSGTYNDKCNTWHADRIWFTWHFGDGVESSG
jgi:hypothetical protein